MTSKHDQTIEFECLHPSPSKHRSKTCSHKTCGSAQFIKHHTEQHRSCTMLRLGEDSPSCHGETPKVRPKRIWGCWFCPSAYISVDNWVAHHMQQHHGDPRTSMDHDWLMKSLLSQKLVRRYWQDEVKALQKSTERTWNFWWCAGEDQARDEIIEGLETGFWRGHDLQEEPQACRNIVAAVMSACVQQARTEHDHFTKIPGLQSSTKRPPSSSPPLKRQRSFCLALRRSKTSLEITSEQADSVPKVPAI